MIINHTPTHGEMMASVYDPNGKATDIFDYADKAGVASFNGRTGLVVPQSGDYTCDMVGAAPASKFLFDSKTVYVAKTGNDETGDGTASNPYLTIQKAVDSLPGNFTDIVTVEIGAGTYDENVSLRLFSGNELRIFGKSGESVKVKTLIAEQSNVVRLFLRNLEFTDHSTDGYNWTIACSDLANVYIDGVTTTNEVTSGNYGTFRFSRCANVLIYNSTISNKHIGIDVSSSHVYLSIVSGTGNTTAIRCGSGWGQVGGMVQKGYNVTIEGAEVKQCGGQIFS